jgi:hypothetical protein
MQKVITGSNPTQFQNDVNNLIAQGWKVVFMDWGMTSVAKAQGDSMFIERYIVLLEKN